MLVNPEITKVKNKYLDQGDHIRAYSQKVGATYLFHQQVVPPRSLMLPQDEVLRRRDDTEVRLYVRHPLDRFISAFRFFTQRGRSLVIRPHCPPEADKIIRSSTSTLPEWAEAALDNYDDHWNSQVGYHTHPSGVFVPNWVADLAYLGGHPVNTSRRKSYEEELADFPELRKKLEQVYAVDLDMFERVAGLPEGIRL